MQPVIAVDAGGTHTRAVVADSAGRCLGVGTAGSGNPTSAGLAAAMAAVTDAVGTAVRQARAAGADEGATGGGARDATRASAPLEAECVLIAMAGHGVNAPIPAIAGAVEAAGALGPVRIESDILAMFSSGTPAGDGYALASGTGAAAIRIRDHRIRRTTDGTGWLMGDHGSGFSIGRAVVRAVTADLDGTGPATALTDPLLAATGVARDDTLYDGRVRTLHDLIDVVYALKPVQLSRFAPLVFRAADDEVARRIRVRTADGLAATLTALLEDDTVGPLVLGGSVLTAGVLPDPELRERMLAGWHGRAEPVIPAADGAIGAVVLALVRSGVPVDTAVFELIGSSLAALRGA